MVYCKKDDNFHRANFLKDIINNKIAKIIETKILLLASTMESRQHQRSSIINISTTPPLQSVYRDIL